MGADADVSIFHDRKVMMQRSQFASTLRRGLAPAWPICLGYLPIGMALGVLGQKAGLHPLAIGFMSLDCFRGEFPVHCRIDDKQWHAGT
jgi:hypothetical protein